VPLLLTFHRNHRHNLDHKEVTMKKHNRIFTLPLFTILCLTLSAIPSAAQQLYDNGPINGNYNGYLIDGALAVSDSFTLAANSNITGFNFGVWVLQGETPVTVDWSISSQAQGGTVFGSGTASLSNVFHNSHSSGGQGAVFDIFDSFAAVNVSLPAGNYWLNLTNGLGSEEGLGMYWDINSGTGCGGSDGHGANCPSSGYFNLTGPIPSESFTIDGGSGGSTPEPSSLALFGSGVLGLGGLLRQRFLG
jgi:PEP-CTERM motif